MEGRTGSLGHLVVWEDEEPGRWVSDNDSSASLLASILLMGSIKPLVPTLGALGSLTRRASLK